MTRREELNRNLAASPTIRLIPLAGHVVSQHFSRMFGEQDGLTASSAAVLGVLGWGAGRGFDTGTPGRATHAELARRCMIAPATVTGVVNTLVKAGYLRRERDAGDRRVVWLVLTEAGEERLRNIGRQIRSFTDPVMEGVDPSHEVIIRDFLIHVITHYTVADPARPGECDGDGHGGDGPDPDPESELAFDRERGAQDPSQPAGAR